MRPPAPSPGTGFPDRVRDQEVWARCLVPNIYDEGRLVEGQVFQVGHSVADGSKLIRVPYPAVRMEWFRSNGYAERVAGAGDGAQDLSASSVEQGLKEVRSRRTARKGQEDGLPDADGGPDPVRSHA